MFLEHRLIFAGLGLIMGLAVIYSIARRKLSTEFSLLWVLTSLFLLLQLVPSDWLPRLCGILHVQPVALLVFIFSLFAFSLLFYYSILLSRLNENMKRLIQKAAILENERKEDVKPAGKSN